MATDTQEGQMDLTTAIAVALFVALSEDDKQTIIDLLNAGVGGDNS